jgi:polysaccharide export outer membrane protein
MNHRRIACVCFLPALILAAGAVMPGSLRAQGDRIQPVQAQPDTRQQPSDRAYQQVLPSPAPPEASSDQATTGGSYLASPAGNSSLAPGQATASAAAPDYVIGPEDVLNINVFNVPDLTQTVRVANDGTIPVLLLGEVKAEGLTAEELQSKLDGLYGRTYLQNPLVTVYVSQFNAQPVSVIGAVSRPGVYQLTGKRTLIEMLSLAGGLGTSSISAPAGRYVFVTRRGGFPDLQTADGMTLLAPDELRIDLHKLLYSHASALNILIKPRDIISVSRAEVVYVTGRGVVRPGGFVLGDRNDLTVLQAVAMAEGLSPNASPKDTRIIHTRADGTHSEVHVNLDKILRGKAPDPVLEANDILWVPNSTQKKALKQALSTTIATVSGVLIFGKL